MKSPYDPLTVISSAKQLDELDTAHRAATGMELQKFLLPQSSALAEAMRGIDSTHKLIEAATGGSRLAEVVRGITGPMDQINASIASARQLHEAFGVNSVTSRFAEAARVISDALAPVSTSFSSARQISEVLESVKINARMFNDQFRVANHADWTRISEMVSAATQPLQGIAEITRQFDQLSKLSLPVIKLGDSLHSARAIAELSTIGAAVNIAPPFNAGLVRTLRADLGDWRDTILDPTAMLDDPDARVAAYVSQGFNTELTDFPAQSFDATLAATNISLGTVHADLAPPPSEDVPEGNRKGYDWIYILETRLRAFIVNRLQAVHPRWEQRLPSGMYEQWQERKAKEMAEGRPEQPIIHYADFADYNDIILGNANWRDCFKQTFKRQEAVREAFNRLRPIRIVVAHMRILTSEEHMLLNLEVRRLLRAIGYL
jgi:hypothetical protein